MTLSELKTGMIVTRRDGKELVVFKFINTDNCFYDCIFVNASENSWYNANEYFLDDLRHNSDSMWDIVKVETSPHPYALMNVKYHKSDRGILWEEKNIKEVTMAEIEAKFGCKVKIVR